tara:strand:- start:1055 stop:1930 length:876 start_codon:yes stop_codon:yes gene_type:complete
MSYKGLTGKDVIVSPLTVNYAQSITSAPSDSTGDIPVKLSGSNVDYIDGEIGTGSLSLVYNSIKQLYYSNFISESNQGHGINIPQIQYNSDGTTSGPVISPIFNNNYPQSITETRTFPTGSGANIKVLSIPRKLFGDYIQPGSFNDGGSGKYADNNADGNIFNVAGDKVGNILYGAGIVVITGDTDDFANSNFKSSYTIFETQYKCTIEAGEFNYSLNPSLLSSSIRAQDKIRTTGSADYEGFVTSSFFTPYVTTVGLYNDNKELIAVGKLAQPLALSQHVDTTILVNLDR